MAADYRDFEIHEIQELRKFRKPKYEEKYIDLAQSLASWAENRNFETNLLSYKAKQLDENKQMSLYD